MTVAMLVRFVESGICVGYFSTGMPSSSVAVTLCCAGKSPVIRVARAGEHMHEFVNALLNVMPFFWSDVKPGRFF